MSIHKMFTRIEYAIEYAKKIAIDKYGKEDVDEVSDLNDNYLRVDDCIVMFTSRKSDGYQCNIYCVVRMDTIVNDAESDVIQWMSNGTLELPVKKKFRFEVTYRFQSDYEQLNESKTWVSHRFVACLVNKARRFGVDGLEFTDLFQDYCENPESFTFQAYAYALNSSVIDQWLSSNSKCIKYRILSENEESNNEE